MALLEGLEISVVKYSEAFAASYSSRLDSTFFKKEFIHQKTFINSKTLSDLCQIKSGTTPRDRDEELKEGIILLKTNNIRNGILSFTNVDDYFYIDNTTNIKMKATKLKPKDVLINIVGATTDVIGRASILSSNFPKANITQAMSFLRIKDEYKTLLNPYYLFIFIVSKFGHQQVRRIARPTGQYNMNNTEVGSFSIPLLSINFQNYIENTILKSDELKEKSISLYTTAEAELLAALGLSDYQPSTENVQVKSLKDSFLNSGRLDAEYYQPKYEEIEAKIKDYIGGWDYLGNRIETIDTGEYSNYYLEKSDGLKFFIRNTNIKNGFVQEAITHFVNPNDFKKFVRTNDILTARVGAIGSFGTVTEEFDGCIFSDNVLKIRFPNNFSSEVYTMYFNSSPNQELMERIAGGSVQPLVTQTTLKQILIPIFKEELQTKVSNAIKQSFLLKKQSKQLLHIAKTGVEKAIEANEAAAMAWMEAEIASLDL